MGVEQNGTGTPVDIIGSWLQELGGLDPRSHDYAVALRAIADLAGEAGVVVPEQSPALVDPAIPPIFSSVRCLEQPLLVPAAEFADILPLRAAGTLALKAVELGVEGLLVRVVDLRAVLARCLGDLAPTPTDARRLNTHFYRDMVYFLKNSLQGRPVRSDTANGRGPCCTKVFGTKLRSYWSMVHVLGEDNVRLPTVARFGDCANNAGKQVTLYRRLFGITLR